MKSGAYRTAGGLAAYYLALFFADRCLISPFVYGGTRSAAYTPAGLLGVTALFVLLVGLLLLGPFLAGRANRAAWAAWGGAAFAVNLAAYALASLAAGLFSGDLSVHAGVSVHDGGFFGVLRLAYVVALYALAAWLGCRSGRAAERGRAMRRTAKLAVG